MIMRAAWRSRTTARRRTLAASATFLLIGGVGLGLMWLVMAALRGLDAPPLLASAPWSVPTIAAVAWTLRRPRPGVVTEDGADSWLMFSIRATLVGVDAPRPRPVRALAAVLFGAPTAWGLLVVGVLVLVGVA